MLTQQQRIDRQSGLGGSDAASVVGISPWKSAYDLYLSKVEPIEEASDDSIHLQLGNVLEAGVRELFTLRTGIPVKVDNTLYRHPDYPFLIANIDGIIDDETGIEIKTASGAAADKWGDGPDEIPEYYLTQVLHYCGIMGWKRCYVAVLLMGHKPEYRQYLIEADQEAINALFQLEINFWNNHVVPRVPPLMTSKELTKNWDKTNPTSIDATPEIVEKCGRLKELRAESNKLDYEMGDIERDIKAFISDNEQLMFLGKPLATWKFNKPSRRFDEAAFAKDCPEIYESYSKEVKGARVLRLK